MVPGPKLSSGPIPNVRARCPRPRFAAGAAVNGASQPLACFFQGHGLLTQSPLQCLPEPRICSSSLSIRSSPSVRGASWKAGVPLTVTITARHGQAAIAT